MFPERPRVSGRFDSAFCHKQDGWRNHGPQAAARRKRYGKIFQIAVIDTNDTRSGRYGPAHFLFIVGFNQGRKPQRIGQRKEPPQCVIIEDGVCKLADRSALAGSVATMDRLIRTMVQKAEIPLEDAVRMASETPARIMGVSDRKGTLQRGKDADIVLLDRDLNVRAVWAMGKLVEGTNKLF